MYSIILNTMDNYIINYTVISRAFRICFSVFVYKEGALLHSNAPIIIWLNISLFQFDIIFAKNQHRYLFSIPIFTNFIFNHFNCL